MKYFPYQMANVFREKSDIYFGGES